MTCSCCGAQAKMQRASYCARCLLMAANADAEAAISTGTEEAPPCELISIMGDSPRATTFLGEQTWPVRRLVAIKLFKDARLWDKTPPAQSLMLRHPSIAPVLETGLLGGRPYVMTAYLAGGTLPRCYDRHRLGSGARVGALIGIADALAVAHARGTVHGRLTASNLLCQPHAPFAVQIVDFHSVSAVVAGEDELDRLAQGDLAAVVHVAEALLRSPVAQVPAAVDLAAELSRVKSAQCATDIRSGLQALAGRLASQ